MSPMDFAPLSGRYLSFAEREEIALLHARGLGVREIAEQIGRSPATVSRELRRSAATRSGGLEYRAITAQWHADRRAKRPKPAKLAENERLRAYVQARLAGTVTGADGKPIRGPDVRPIRAFGNERWLLYASSDAKYFEPVTGTKFEISGYDAGAYPYRDHYYALLVEFDPNSVLQHAQVVEWSVATGPYQLSPLAADAFGIPAEELLFVRPFDWRFGETGHGGVYVATPGFIGAAVWKRDHYEASWKHPYSDIESVSYEQYRSGTFWLERSVRILVKPRNAETIEIEPFEESFDAEFHVVNDFEDLASKFILNSSTDLGRERALRCRSVLDAAGIF